MLFQWLWYLFAVAVAAREWVAYFRAASKIRSVARSEGSDWPFMRDPKFMALFVYAPHALLDPDDSERLRAVKLELLILRKRMWRVVGLAMALVTIGFFLEIFWHIFSGVWWEE